MSTNDSNHDAPPSEQEAPPGPVVPPAALPLSVAPPETPQIPAEPLYEDAPDPHDDRSALFAGEEDTDDTNDTDEITDEVPRRVAPAEQATAPVVSRVSTEEVFIKGLPQVPAPTETPFVPSNAAPIMAWFVAGVVLLLTVSLILAILVA